jgi:hypothetical protein
MTRSALDLEGNTPSPSYLTSVHLLTPPFAELVRFQYAGADDKIRPEAVDAVCAVVAHEIGHAALQHNWVLLGVMAVQFLGLFGTFRLCMSDPRMVLDFGYDEVRVHLAFR